MSVQLFTYPFFLFPFSKPHLLFQPTFSDLLVKYNILGNWSQRIREAMLSSHKLVPEDRGGNVEFT